jgi:predicted DNA-binding transcriptional regulator AlpA
MQVLTFDEAAKRASLTRRSIERLLSIGEGPATVSLGKRRRGIIDRDLEQWLLGRRVSAPGENADHPHEPPRAR